MSMLEAVLQGVLQGLTEFLPVSSSGHLSLFQHFAGIAGEGNALLFTVLLHLGTLLAVAMAFYRTIWELIAEFFVLLKEILTGKFSFRNRSPMRNMIYMLLLAQLPMGISFLFRDLFERASQDSDILLEGVCFLITAGLLFFSDRCVKGHKDADGMKARDALLIGAAQAVAPLPGISRSGATISAGLLSGLTREYAVSFSFIMGIPAVLGANLLEIGDALEQSMTINMPVFLAGMGAAFVVGLLAIKLVSLLIRTDRLNIFAYYTCAIGVITMVLGLVEAVTGKGILALFS